MRQTSARLLVGAVVASSNAQADLHLRRMTADDFDELFRMKSDTDDVRASGFAAPPDRSQFRKWFLQSLSGQGRLMFLALNGADQAVGYLYIRFAEAEAHAAEISYGVKSQFRGQGYGARMNALAVDYAVKELSDLTHLVSWITEDNAPSMRNFLSIGYTDTGETKSTQFQLPSPHIKLMRKFVFDLRRRRS